MKSNEFVDSKLFVNDLKHITNTGITPKLAIAFFVLAGLFAAVWVWTSLILN